MTTKKKVIDNHKVLQAAPVDECLAFVKQAKTAFGVPTPPLSKLDKRHTAKPLIGSPDIVKMIARLATEYGVTIPKHSVGTMLQNLQTVQTLAPLKAAVLAFHKNVDDAMLSSNGDAWSSATAFYTVLRRVEGSDAELAAALAPLATFFKKGRAPSKKTSSTPKTATKASSPSAGSAASPSAAVAESNGAPAGVVASHA
jgi:hypothetical protein